MSEITDDERLQFLSTKAESIHDLTVSEAKLVDDICLNGERQLTPMERHMTDEMMKLYKRMRKNL